MRWLMAQNRHNLGMREVSINCNGIHLSAGPLEGMVEVIRFFASTIETGEPTWVATAFGQPPGREGLAPGDIRELAMNPTLEHQGQRLSAFDLTEQRDARDVVSLLRAAAKRQDTKAVGGRRCPGLRSLDQSPGPGLSGHTLAQYSAHDYPLRGLINVGY